MRIDMKTIMACSKHVKASNKGILGQLPLAFIMLMVSGIILFNVAMPTLNTGITSTTANLNKSF